jgi:hypothetical protein
MATVADESILAGSRLGPLAHPATTIATPMHQARRLLTPFLFMGE